MKKITLLLLLSMPLWLQAQSQNLGGIVLQGLTTGFCPGDQIDYTLTAVDEGICFVSIFIEGGRHARTGETGAQFLSPNAGNSNLTFNEQGFPDDAIVASFPLLWEDQGALFCYSVQRCDGTVAAQGCIEIEYCRRVP